jgi:hypothetical protein
MPDPTLDIGLSIDLGDLRGALAGIDLTTLFPPSKYTAPSSLLKADGIHRRAAIQSVADHLRDLHYDEEM